MTRPPLKNVGASVRARLTDYARQRDENACESAWGHGADRRASPLISRSSERSVIGACSTLRRQLVTQMGKIQKRETIVVVLYCFVTEKGVSWDQV